MDEVEVVDVHLGDTLYPVGFVFLREGDDGDEVVDLTGMSVKFRMLDGIGTEVVAETDAGVDIDDDPTTGRVTYDFSASGVDEAGTFYGYFAAYDGDEFATFPVKRRKLKIVVHAD